MQILTILLFFNLGQIFKFERNILQFKLQLQPSYKNMGDTMLFMLNKKSFLPKKMCCFHRNKNLIASKVENSTKKLYNYIGLLKKFFCGNMSINSPEKANQNNNYGARGVGWKQ